MFILNNILKINNIFAAIYNIDMELKIIRRAKKDTYTIGTMYINGVKFSDTLEDIDRGISADMPMEQIIQKKIYSQTAIPTGTYSIEMTWSNKFHNRGWCKRYKGECPQIMNVKGFEGVRIHPFNRADETLGCISVGRNLQKGMVLQATNHFYKLMDEHLLPAIKKGEKITLVIE